MADGNGSGMDKRLPERLALLRRVINDDPTVEAAVAVKVLAVEVLDCRRLILEVRQQLEECARLLEAQDRDGGSEGNHP